jgi:hypothetical protein
MIALNADILGKDHFGIYTGKKKISEIHPIIPVNPLRPATNFHCYTLSHLSISPILWLNLVFTDVKFLSSLVYNSIISHLTRNTDRY